MLPFSLIEDILDFSRQLGENINIGRGIVMGTLFLTHQRNVDECHQRHSVFTFAPFICLSIGIVALGDELGCTAIVFLVVTVDDNFYVFVIDVQPDM